MQNPFLFVLMFLVLLAAFHLILNAKRDRITARHWVMVEYFWLAGAGFGLLTAGLELRRVTFQAEAQASRSALSNEWNQTRIAARSALDILSTPIPKCIAITRPPSPECQAMLKWFQYAANALDLGVETQRWRHFLFQNANINPEEVAKPPGSSRVPQLPSWDFDTFPKHAPPEALEFAQGLLTKMRVLDTHLGEVHAKEAAASFHWYDLLARTALPWYLTFALALKIAKNSAEYLKTKDDKSPPHRPTKTVAIDEGRETTAAVKSLRDEATEDHGDHCDDLDSVQMVGNSVIAPTGRQQRPQCPDCPSYIN